MKLLDDIRFRWAWRDRRLALPGRRDREPSPYGYALPRTGLAPAAVAAIVAAALAAGGWLGMQTGSGGGSSSADPAGLLDPQAPTAAAGATSREADRRAIAALSTARADGRRDLTAATRPSEQAAAALGLRRAHLRAAKTFKGAEPALAGVLRRNAGAYGALARAAEDGDPRAYARASTAVASAERDLERLIGSVL
jgi:hypothetical protein